MKTSVIIIFLGFIFHFPVLSQKYHLDDEAYENWDGITHWSKYLIYSPKYFGPNALSVPDVPSSVFDEEIKVGMQADKFWCKGDNASSFETKAYYPLKGNIVAFKFSYIPYEKYDMDTFLCRERRTFHLQGKGVTSGDVNLGMKVMVLQNRKILPNICIGGNIRMPAGGGRMEARYTDSPGYHFYLLLGKRINRSDNFYIDFSTILGGYFWQTNIDNNPQNDAVLYGGMVECKIFDYKAKIEMAGYRGYMDIGDRPVVFKSRIAKEYKFLELGLRYQKGIKDYSYSSIGFYLIFKYKRKSKAA